MDKYPSIESFRTAMSAFKSRYGFLGVDENKKPVYDSIQSFPIIRYRGTVKLHGTHADIVRNSVGDEKVYHYQSRNNIVKPGKDTDNSGFAAHMSMPVVTTAIENLFNQFEDLAKTVYHITSVDHLMISGEWCGGNIQKGVALTQLEKMFVIYSFKINDMWYDPKTFAGLVAPSAKIYNILDFSYWEINIDMNKPELKQNDLVKITEEVENCCPVGKFFGVSGVGEGVVWNLLGTVNNVDDTYYEFNLKTLGNTKNSTEAQWSCNPTFTFKVKGQEHSVTKVKTLVEVDLELMKNCDDLVECVCTEARLKQGLEYLKEQHLEAISANTMSFTRWIVSDIYKEETERITASGFAEKDTKKKFDLAVSKKASTWFKIQVNLN